MGSGKKISPARFLHISSPQNTQPLVGRKVQTYDKARVGHLNTCRIVSTTDEYDRKELLLEQHYATDTRKHICDDSIALCRGCIGLARSRFHLLWLFPVSYNASFFTLRSRILAFFVAVRIRSGLHNSVKLVCL